MVVTKCWSGGAAGKDGQRIYNFNQRGETKPKQLITMYCILENCLLRVDFKHSLHKKYLYDVMFVNQFD